MKYSLPRSAWQLFVILTVIPFLHSCQSPFLTFAGKHLQGIEAKTDSFAFASQYKLLKLEVNERNPYSVILRVTVIDGELYVDAAEKRRWADFLGKDAAVNNAVRVKLGDTIYPAQAVVITDPQITNAFSQGRTIYRLTPIGR